MNSLNKIILILSLFAWLLINKAHAQINTDSLHFYLSKVNKSLTKDLIDIYIKEARRFATGMQSIQLSRIEAKHKKAQGDFERAYIVYNKSIEKSKANNYKVLEGLLYFDLSNYYYDLNKYEASYEYVVKAKNIIENISDKALDNYNRNNLKNKQYTRESLLEPILFNIGVVAHDNNDLDKAEMHYKESLLYFINKKDSTGQYITLSNLAGINISKKEYKKAIQSNIRILKDYDLKLEDESLVYYNIAISYFELNDYTSATIYIDKAINISENIKDELQLIDLRLLKGEIELNMGNISHAKVLLEKSLDGAIAIDDYMIQEDLYKLLAKSDMRLKNYEQADVWLDKMIFIKDSLLKTQTNAYYKKINLEEKLNQQDKILAKEKHAKNLLLWLIFLGIIMGIVSIYAFFISKKNASKKLLLTRKEIELNESKREQLRFLEENETKQLQEELASKKRELMQSILYNKKIKKKIDRIIDEIKNLENKTTIIKSDLTKIRKLILRSALDMNKEEVHQSIMNIHENFFVELLNDYPKLSKTELRVLAFIRLGLSTKEIADAQFVSLDAVKKTRYRIRKKINIESTISLEKFIFKY